MRLCTITALLLVSYVVAQRRPQTDNCNQIALNACTHNLGTYWDIDTSMIWKGLNYLSNAVDTQMKLPYTQYNYLNICNGFSQFYACLGPTNIANCLGTVGFMGMGMDPTSAYQYEGYLASWRFKCGGGFYMTYENAGLSTCTQSTHLNYKTDMQNYINQYTANVTADTSGACNYAQNLMNNIGGIYSNGCRAVDQEQGRIYGCQSAREYTNAQFTHCQHVTTCKKN